MPLVTNSYPMTTIPEYIDELTTGSEPEKMTHYSRRKNSDPKQPYQEMLIREMPENSQVQNEPQYAVLESELTHGTQNVRDHALIHYLATLANSNKRDDNFDFDFVKSLIRNGADINSTDKTGQTIFHEVARSWNTGVAMFLITNGANVNQQDQFGRSPLHVAAAVDYAEMVEFLLQNGADIAIKTKGEEQTPMHFAAKNDAVNSLQMLLGYHANIDARDSKNRTPLQVSAQMNRSKAATFLVGAGAPAGVQDKSGYSALSLLIEKIPDVALQALDQFYSKDAINRKECYFLNYLEGAKLQEQKTKARSPLDIAVHNERFDIILHPVMQRLIRFKWKTYGQRGAILHLVLNLLYAIVWTILGVKIPRNGRDLYIPLQTHAWRLFAAAFIILFTLVEIKWQITNVVKSQTELKKWREWRGKQLEEDLEFCHPRWPQEIKYLQAEIKAVRNLSIISGSDWWIYFDWVALVLILATITTHVLFFIVSTDDMKELHHHTMIPLLMVLWFRIFKYARPFESAGPFIVIFGSVMGDILKWGVLNSVILLPFTCAFWITFGAVSLHPVHGYDTVGHLCYNMFSMMVVGDHDFKDLEEVNPFLAKLLCGSFIGIAAIVTVNLLIALLSNTFNQLHENAVANAMMQRARTILLLEKSLRRKQKENYYNLIKKKGSPETVQSKDMLCSTRIEDCVTIDRVYDGVKTINNILSERFGKRFGKNRQSDMDVVKEDLKNVKLLEERLADDVKDMKMVLRDITKRLFESWTDGNYKHRNNNNNDHRDNDDDNNDNDGNDDDDDNNSSSNNNSNNKSNNINNYLHDNRTETALIKSTSQVAMTLSPSPINSRGTRTGSRENNSESPTRRSCEIMSDKPGEYNGQVWLTHDMTDGHHGEEVRDNPRHHDTNYGGNRRGKYARGFLGHDVLETSGDETTGHRPVLIIEGKQDSVYSRPEYHQKNLTPQDPWYYGGIQGYLPVPIQYEPLRLRSKSAPLHPGQERFEESHQREPALTCVRDGEPRDRPPPRQLHDNPSPDPN